eukprot:CAMPEP_0184646714 /NCGR_PEP_ID=MMETSP0308-20130426/3463_1 /TAXON_ID=38269 /ORGANISM="Gloeochaete witrockiana, Strain SAG 46.84" /LENGTH=445 /DNA_ID=CAMNT_0027076993 /DNA_START=49 /DNA_END=1387 /DNA_ORIENTATION=+
MRGCKSIVNYLRSKIGTGRSLNSVTVAESASVVKKIEIRTSSQSAIEIKDEETDVPSIDDKIRALRPLLVLWWFIGLWCRGGRKYSWIWYQVHCLWRGVIVFNCGLQAVTLGWAYGCCGFKGLIPEINNATGHIKLFSHKYDGLIFYSVIFSFIGAFCVRVLRTERRILQTKEDDALVDTTSRADSDKLANDLPNNFGALADILHQSEIADVQEFAPMERWGSGIYLFTGSFLVALVALAIAAMYVTVIYLLCRRVSVFTKKLRKNIEEMISRKSCLMTLDDVGLNEIGLLCRERFQVVSLVKGSCGMMTWLVTPAVTLGSAAAYRIIWDCLGPPMWAFCVVTGVMFLSIVVFCLLGGAVLTYQCTKVEETLRELRSRFPYADSIGLRQLQSDLDSFILLSKNDVFGFEVFGFLITFNVLLRALYIIGVIGLAAMQSRFGWNFNF